MYPHHHHEHHRLSVIGWLRAAVLGANDGIISIASLLIGVAAAHTDHRGILIAGIAALIAGAMSMAAGEYISVSSQRDTEQAELQREKYELEHNTAYEREELAAIYMGRGLQPDLAREVAKQLMEHDSLGAHSRDELGITEPFSARPLQAALFSAGSFTLGAILPLIIALFVPRLHLIVTILIVAIILLALLGALAAKIGGAKILTGALRVTIWGTLAMLLSAVIGYLMGAPS